MLLPLVAPCLVPAMGGKEGLEQQADQTAKAQLDWLDVDLFSEDSSLILSAEGPLGILLGLYYPGYTSMGLGVLVLFRLLQLENIGKKEHFRNLFSLEV